MNSESLHLCVIACEVFSREFWSVASRSPHRIDFTSMPFGLHDTPDLLRQRLQETIDAVPPGRYDAILIGYGLCSRGTAELVARHTPLVFVRAHDCITLFLGSKERYLEEFTGHPGTYYYTAGWIERKEGQAEQGHIRSIKDTERQTRYERYVEQYGEDNAQYLIDMETGWLDNYSRATLINLDIGDTEAYRTFVHGVADTHGWAYEEIPGDMRLIEQFLGGDWNQDGFLVVPPGGRMIDTNDERIITIERDFHERS